MSTSESLLSDLREIRDTLICPFADELVWGQKSSEWIGDCLSVIPRWEKGVYRFPLDGGKPNSYRTLSLEQSVKFLEWVWINNLKYHTDRWDCENFAIGATAIALLFHHFSNLFGWNALGIVIDWSGSHGYNEFITTDGSLYFLEPQNMKYWPESEHLYSEQYKCDVASIFA